MSSGVESVILGYGARRARTSDTDAFVEGRVHHVTTAGMFFTVPDWDNGRFIFGPAPWAQSSVDVASTHDHVGTTPPAGTRCLVLFLGSGVDRPWVVGWWPV